ncbi:MarR family winged helix-turn-helix transcriptional regulator [Tomitella biformata]|uniref:MarR family winged helix-turn-helix transcriptional regulator n=1 Tax=Tomitella biformata TaxID=630403 RepID=UPI0004663C2D|nr:MarR family transcriptional regulator [Tomitella biformata]
MEKPTDMVEFETMLLARHMMRQSPHPRRAAGHLDSSAYTLLSRISVEGPMSIGELSAAFGLDSSTLQRQTAAVLRDGLVDRIPDPDGGMARKFRINAEGSRRLLAHREENMSGLEKVMADWSVEDVAEFAGWLQRFNTDIERLAENLWPRPES